MILVEHPGTAQFIDWPELGCHWRQVVLALALDTAGHHSHCLLLLLLPVLLMVVVLVVLLPMPRFCLVNRT
jgi:hypothetical protein